MDKALSSLRKKKHALFALNFLNHVHSFIKEHGLINSQKKIAISVSGGVDSQVLAHVLCELNYNVELIHFNHGTRKFENHAEEALVRAYAKSSGVPLHVFPLNFSLSDKNFEMQARNARQSVYQDFIKKGYWVYTAHHIDDSFEWSLMQSFKQSSLMSSIGMPIFNNGLVKPFMCVTKKQIYRFAKACQLSWLEDSSNSNNDFERNFLRTHITKVILKKYPQALAHYVSRSNQLIAKNSSTDLLLKKEAGGVVIVAKNLELHKEAIKKVLYELSNKDRGEVDHEINKLIRSQKEIMSDNKNFPFKGPMNFSGGVSAFLIKDHLMMMDKNQLNFYLEYDQHLKDIVSKSPQIPKCFIISEFPYLIISIGKTLNKSSKFIHPLLPVTTLWLKNQGISYSFAPVMGVSDRQLIAFDAVILDSSKLGK